METPAAIRTEYLSLKDIGGIWFFWHSLALLADLFPIVLYRLKNRMADNRLMGMPCNDQIIVSGLYLLVVYNFGLALYQITGINLTFQYLHYSTGLPFPAPDQPRAGNFTGSLFIMAWGRNPHFIQITHNTV